MDARRAAELLLVLGLVAGGVLWFQNRAPAPPKPVASPSVSSTPQKSGLYLTINGVCPKMTLSQVEQLLGQPNTPYTEEITGVYTFGAASSGNLTTVEVNARHRIVLVHGERLELDGRCLAESLEQYSDDERDSVRHELESILGPMKLKQGFGGTRANYPEHALRIAITKNGAWVFELGEHLKEPHGH